jgi:hypothetical protein
MYIVFNVNNLRFSQRFGNNVGFWWLIYDLDTCNLGVK